MQKLVEKTISTISNAKGEWGVVLEDLDTGDLWEKNSKSIFYSASVIKLPIMATIFSEAEKGNVDLQSKVLLRKEDIVGGAGVMQHMTPGTYLTIYDIIVLMIIQSDNTATNILIDLVGVNAIAEFMQNIGMTNSTFSHKLMDKKADHKVRNVITPFDIATFLRKLYKEEVVSSKASKQLIDIMIRQQIRDCLGGKLPYQELDNDVSKSQVWKLANKTGWIPGTRHDVGIFYLNNKCFLASILSKDVDDLESKEVLADIGKYIFTYMKNS